VDDQLARPVLTIRAGGPFGGVVTIAAAPDGADTLGVSSAEVALAWVRSRPAVTSTLIGARTIEQPRSNLASLDVTLTPEQLAALNEPSTPSLVPAAITTELTPTFGFRRSDRRRRRAPPVAAAAHQLSPLLSPRHERAPTAARPITVAIRSGLPKPVHPVVITVPRGWRTPVPACTPQQRLTSATHQRQSMWLNRECRALRRSRHLLCAAVGHVAEYGARPCVARKGISI
jgi:hypothetical protein